MRVAQTLLMADILLGRPTVDGKWRFEQSLRPEKIKIALLAEFITFGHHHSTDTVPGLAQETTLTRDTLWIILFLDFGAVSV